LAYGTKLGAGLGTDMEVVSYEGDSFVEVFAGEAADTSITSCVMDWGGGYTEPVQTNPKGKIHQLWHEYERSGRYKIRYTCRTANEVSVSVYNLDLMFECYTAEDCEGRPHSDCGGYWTCVFNKCEWECYFINESENPEEPVVETTAARERCIDYCSSEEAKIQAKFFEWNQELYDIGYTEPNCLSILDELTPCSKSFKEEFNILLYREGIE